MATTFPESVPSGLDFIAFEETVDLSGTAAANFPLTFRLPAGAVLVSASMVLNNAAGGATSTKVGFGRVTATADPDKYLLTADKTASTTRSIQNQWSAPLAAIEQIGIFACDNAGAAAGTIGGVVGLTAKVNGVYAIAETTSF
jgi:hypothetical protein